MTKIRFLILLLICCSCEQRVIDVVVEKPVVIQVRYNLWGAMGYVKNDTAHFYLIGDGTNYGSLPIHGLQTRGWFFRGVDSIRAGSPPVSLGYGRIGKLNLDTFRLDSMYSDLVSGQYFNHRTDFQPFYWPLDTADLYYQFAMILGGDTLPNQSIRPLKLDLKPLQEGH